MHYLRRLHGMMHTIHLDLEVEPPSEKRTVLFGFMKDITWKFSFQVGGSAKLTS